MNFYEEGDSRKSKMHDSQKNEEKAENMQPTFVDRQTYQNLSTSQSQGFDSNQIDPFGDAFIQKGQSNTGHRNEKTILPEKPAKSPEGPSYSRASYGENSNKRAHRGGLTASEFLQKQQAGDFASHEQYYFDEQSNQRQEQYSSENLSQPALESVDLETPIEPQVQKVLRRIERKQKPVKLTGLYILLIALLLVGLAVLGGIFFLTCQIDDLRENGLWGSLYQERDDEEGEPLRMPPQEETPNEGRLVPAFGIAEEGLTTVDSNMSVADIADQAKPAVVSVISKINIEQNGQKIEQHVGGGSGIILTRDGYILTNCHVIEDSDITYVSFGGDETQEEIPAKLIGYDKIRDLAVIKIARDDLVTTYFGDSNLVRTGDTAIAIGNPMGSEDSTLTMGIISSSHRRVDMGKGRRQVFFQTDASINPGNSGGALINAKGEVIGINTLKQVFAGATDFGMPLSAEGIGYAIPINDALAIAEALIRDGHIPYAGIGLDGYVIDENAAIQTKGKQGIRVTKITPKGSAQLGGVREGDIIMSCDGISSTTLYDLVDYVDGKKVGESIELKIWRQDREIELKVKLVDIAK